MLARISDDNFQVNNHSFSTFANTISFNISRYPTPVEITDSKDYRGPDNPAVTPEKANGVENGVKRTDEADTVPVSVTTVGDTNIEYVPAEYFRGVDTHQVAQSGEIFVFSQVPLSLPTVYFQFQSRSRSPSSSPKCWLAGEY